MFYGIRRDVRPRWSSTTYNISRRRGQAMRSCAKNPRLCARHPLGWRCGKTGGPAMAEAKRILAIIGSNKTDYNILAGIYQHFYAGRWEVHVETAAMHQQLPRTQLAIREWRPHGIIG